LHQIILKEKVWPTSEHYFQVWLPFAPVYITDAIWQAQKFAGTSHEEEIRLLPKPMAAAQAGRSRTRPLRKDWEEVKEQVMKEALIAKFTQHKALEKLLLSTGNAVLVEATTTDHYWGRGGTIIIILNI
jgi:N-glycosidase YbiA